MTGSAVRASGDPPLSETRSIALPNGGQLHCQFDACDQDAPVLVLSNSVLTDLRIWDDVAPALTQKVNVLRYDQRGHGQSTPPKGPMTFDEYGDDLLALLDAYGLESCIFAGLSMGVPTGLAAFAKAPERFKAFVAVDGVAKSAPGRETFWQERRATARAQGLAVIAAQTAPRWLPGADPDGSIAKRLEQIITGTDLDGFSAATHALEGYDYSAVLPQMSIPFLAIAGAQDGAMPEAMKRQFSTLKQAEFAIIDGAGHVPNFQAPHAFAEALLAKLGALS